MCFSLLLLSSLFHPTTRHDTTHHAPCCMHSSIAPYLRHSHHDHLLCSYDSSYVHHNHGPIFLKHDGWLGILLSVSCQHEASWPAMLLRATVNISTYQETTLLCGKPAISESKRHCGAARPPGSTRQSPKSTTRHDKPRPEGGGSFLFSVLLTSMRR
jgi:hypothetical protein